MIRIVGMIKATLTRLGTCILRLSCFGKLCVHKTIFKSLARSAYHWLQAASTCQVGHVPFESKKNSFMLKCDQEIYIFEDVQNSYEDFIRDFFGPGIYCAGQKCVQIQTCVENNERCYVCPHCQACCHILDALSSDRRSTNQKRDGDRPLCFIKKNSRDYGKDKPSH